jgi:hypothetical protein
VREWPLLYITATFGNCHLCLSSAPKEDLPNTHTISEGSEPLQLKANHSCPATDTIKFKPAATANEKKQTKKPWETYVIMIPGQMTKSLTGISLHHKIFPI